MSINITPYAGLLRTALWALFIASVVTGIGYTKHQYDLALTAPYRERLQAVEAANQTLQVEIAANEARLKTLDALLVERVDREQKLMSQTKGFADALKKLTAQNRAIQTWAAMAVPPDVVRLRNAQPADSSAPGTVQPTRHPDPAGGGP
ncbi:MAG: hypothetical protein JNM52_11055 [Betaproteobacteria bacterium]|nr:hypothetical protein [Betaproteobacteria bacterium]